PRPSRLLSSDKRTSCSLGSEYPCRFLDSARRSLGRRREIVAIEKPGSHAKEVPVVLRYPVEVMAQNLQSAVVAVADQRAETVGTRVVIGELEHMLERA